VRYALDTNDGEHHLHGGARGLHRAVWTAEPFARGGDVGVELRHVSPDGEGGYPGALDVRVTYTLTDDALVLDYRAQTDRATPVNLTQHVYVNLGGHDAGDVLDHELTVAATRYTPTDTALIPTGELRDVRGTPFDFTTPTAIGARIDADDEQLRAGDGYDQNFALDADAPFAARLHDPSSGRTLEIHTTEPGLQLYTGNALDLAAPSKSGRRYGKYAGVALETQRFPDSPNHPNFPSSILRPGETFLSRTVYRFSAR
jgi:aldose 1-epimerase